MRMALGLASLIVLFVLSGTGQKLDQSNSRQEVTLRGFLQDYMRSSYDSSTTRYISAFASLGGLKTKDVIVYFTDQHSCGSGGCTTLILAPSGHSYRVVTSITIGWPPIRVLASKSNGWHDISLWVQGGGIQPGYEATLSFDGVSYPSNPSVLPARRAENKAEGKIVISATAQGKLLY